MQFSPKKFILSTALLSSLATIANAQPAASDHFIIAPHCLTQRLATPYQTISSTSSLSLIKINQAAVGQLIDAKTKHDKPCGGFIDVTRQWHHAAASKTLNADKFLAAYEKPAQSLNALSGSTYKIRYKSEVEQLHSQLSPQNMMDNLNTLTSFRDRYADSATGVKAAEWFKAQIELAASINQRDDVKAYFVKTGGEFQQPSVVAKIGDSNEPGIVIGAHMDTLESSSMSKKPGADDDGSGSVTVLETARAILASGMHFKKPLYFVWYAAEEEGLIGSGYVVEHFKSNNIPVDAVMHFDLTGYAPHGEPTMWIIDDNVNKNLSAFLETLINTYVKQPVKHTRCGYACSDHASWTQAGYIAAMPAEAAYEESNPYMHSGQDTTDKLSLAHMTSYLKLASAFAVELAEPIK